MGTFRKHPAERQPKQSHNPPSNYQAPSRKENVRSSTKLSTKLPEPVESKIDQPRRAELRKPRAQTNKFNSIAPQKPAPQSDFVNTPKGTSFGILAKKNELDQSKVVPSGRYKIESPRNTGDEEDIKFLSSSIPNFNSVRKSYDVQLASSFREPVSARNNQDQINFQSSNTKKRRAEINELKITPLQERRSQTRKMRANTLTRAEPSSPVKVNLHSKLDPGQDSKPIVSLNNLARVNVNDISMEVDESEQFNTYALFTKIMAGALERLGGDHQLQLACLEE